MKVQTPVLTYESETCAGIARPVQTNETKKSKENSGTNKV